MRYKRKYMHNQETGEIEELYRRLATSDARISELERRLSKRQVAGHWIEPTLLNSCAQVSNPLDTFAYRLWSGGRIQFKGHLNVLSATSPVTAFVIPPAESNIHSDLIRHTIITNTAQTTFQVAMVKIEASTGNVIFTWPAN